MTRYGFVRTWPWWKDALMFGAIVASGVALVLIAGCAGFCKESNIANADRRHGPACQSIGFAPASDPWMDCTERLERARRAKVAPVEMKASDGRPVVCKFAHRTTCE